MEVWCPEDFCEVPASRGAEDVPTPPQVEESPVALGLEDDEGGIIAFKVADAFLGKPDGGPMLNIIVVAARDVGTVAEGVETVGRAGMTSISSLGSASLREMTVTQGMPDLITTGGAPKSLAFCWWPSSHP